MKVGLNADGCKHQFCKVYNHNLKAFFGGAYIIFFDLMSVSTCERSSTSKALRFSIVRTFAFYFYFSLQFHFLYTEGSHTLSIGLIIKLFSFAKTLLVQIQFSFTIMNLQELPVLAIYIQFLKRIGFELRVPKF
jgi:hypothetical protein